MRIGLVAGESSGDLLGAGLIRALRDRYPTAKFEGVAGPAMAEAGCEVWESADALALFGLIEPLAHLPRLLRLRRELAQRWIASPPDVFVGIDAPDFNLGLETRLRQSGVKTIHYVSPSIWAWRPGRIKKVKAAADTVLCLLPFEPELYERERVDAVFVGHPRADSIPDSLDSAVARKNLGIDATEVVAVLPGSRNSEIKLLGDILFSAARRIAAARADVSFITPIARPALKSAIETQIDAAGLSDNVRLLDGQSDAAMLAADVVMLASGTAALESALLERPTVAVYRVSTMTAAIMRTFRLMKLTHFTLPNLLTETPLIPEFMQNKARPGPIADAVIALLDDPQRRRRIGDRFARLRTELALNTDQRAADAVVALIK